MDEWHKIICANDIRVMTLFKTINPTPKSGPHIFKYDSNIIDLCFNMMYYFKGACLLKHRGDMTARHGGGELLTSWQSRNSERKEELWKEIDPSRSHPQGLPTSMSSS